MFFHLNACNKRLHWNTLRSSGHFFWYTSVFENYNAVNFSSIREDLRNNGQPNIWILQFWRTGNQGFL